MRPCRHSILTRAHRALHAGADMLLVWCAQVAMADFEHALEEVKPAFGSNVEHLQAYAMHGIINYGEVFDHLQQTLRALVQQVRHVLFAGD